MKSLTIKKILTWLTVLAVLAAGGHFAIRGYVSLRQGRFIKQARECLAKQDERRAALFLQRALRSNPKNVEACRLMAELAERTASPGAVLWRSRVVELNPGSTEDRLALAMTALAGRGYVIATNALAGVSAQGKQTARYHNIAGAVAIAASQPDEAEAHFLEAIRLEPQNLAPQLNLSVLRLQRTNQQALAEARATLKRLSVNPTNGVIRCDALRELVADALRYKQPGAALAIAGQLLSDTNSLFRDRLFRLDILRATTNSEYSSALAACQREAGTNIARIYDLATWQIGRKDSGDALTWLRALPLSLRTNQPVALLEAQCLDLNGDFRGLQAQLQKQTWGELEFVRHAFLSRALRGQQLIDSSKTEWDQALKSTSNQKAGLVMLLQLAAGWRYETEGEDILWTILNRYPGEQWAFQALSQTLFLTGRTRSLMSLFEQQAKKFPSDLSVKNNLAFTAILLDAKELKPYDLAQEVYQKAPTNSSFASTYAFALHLQKKDAEALKVMQQLKPADLEKPTIAGYYGLILKATGNAEKAKAYLASASKARLLPEEKKLFD